MFHFGGSSSDAIERFATRAVMLPIDRLDSIRQDLDRLQVERSTVNELVAASKRAQQETESLRSYLVQIAAASEPTDKDGRRLVLLC